VANTTIVPKPIFPRSIRLSLCEVPTINSFTDSLKKNYNLFCKKQMQLFVSFVINAAIIPFRPPPYQPTVMVEAHETTSKINFNCIVPAEMTHSTMLKSVSRNCGL
jgi:hypothetical protein